MGLKKGFRLDCNANNWVVGINQPKFLLKRNFRNKIVHQWTKPIWTVWSHKHDRKFWRLFIVIPFALSLTTPLADVLTFADVHWLSQARFFIIFIFSDYEWRKICMHTRNRFPNKIQQWMRFRAHVQQKNQMRDNWRTEVHNFRVNWF